MDFNGVDPRLNNAEFEPVTVPLVVYKDDGERVIIGEATINGEQIIGRIGEGDFAEAMLNKIVRGGTYFSLGPGDFDTEKEASLITDRHDWDPNANIGLPATPSS